MPTYDYHCEECSHRLEAFQKITDEALKKCPACQKESLKRGPGGGVGLSFKGSGFYINDYAPSSSDSPPSSAEGTKKACCPCGKNKGSCSS